MEEIFKCPNCEAEGMDNFEFYEEKVIARYRKVTKDGKISKRLDRDMFVSTSMPNGLSCKSCGELLDFELDDEGKIIEIYDKY